MNIKQTQITKCPKCDTTFRVSPTQLEVAKGAVRCGACLHVFRASDHFQGSNKPEAVVQDDRTQDMFAGATEPNATAKPAATSRTAAPKAKPKESAPVAAPKKPVATSPSVDDGEFDFLNDFAEQQPEPAPKPKTRKPVTDFQRIEDDGENFLIDDDNGLIDDDLGEGGLIQKSSRKSPIISDINEDFLSIDGESQVDPFYIESDKLADTVKSDDSEDDESWADALLDESSEVKTKEYTSEDQPLKPAPNKPKFTYIETDPLDLSLPQKANRRQFWIWGSLAALMLVIFAGQVAFFQFDKWARMDQFRPYYSMACEQLGCVLPSAYDVSQIRTTATPQVSSHPRFKNALSVDVLFMNHASYEQAFPKLELTFTDDNEKVIAHRLFSPKEYLAGEASGLTMMPVETPIHIALEIQDPGPKANNYKVRFVAP